MAKAEQKQNSQTLDMVIKVEDTNLIPKATTYGRNDVAMVVIRAMCLMLSTVAVSLMVTARETSMTSLYGFQLQLHAVWSLSDSLIYLVIVSSATALYSLHQLGITGTRLVTKSHVIPTRTQAWFCFAADQILGYAMVSGGSAALGVTNMNRTGIRHMPLPNFCKSLDIFCDHLALSLFSSPSLRFSSSQLLPFLMFFVCLNNLRGHSRCVIVSLYFSRLGRNNNIEIFSLLCLICVCYRKSPLLIWKIVK